jgi:ABC-type sulfate/molybdate transport systems ATPase subunit
VGDRLLDAAGRDILLLDEPLAHLDGPLRADIAEWLRAEIAGRACLLATHDPAEAAILASRLLPLQP